MLHELRLWLGFSRPVRTVYYNLVITGLSVAVALVIGTIEPLSILVDRTGITSGPLGANLTSTASATPSLPSSPSPG